MQSLQFPFHGFATDFTLVNLGVMLLLIALYALLTGWVYALLFHVLQPVVDRAGQFLTRLPGLYMLCMLLGGALIWNLSEAGPILVLFWGLLIAIGSLFGLGPSLAFGPVLIALFAGLFLLGWSLFGSWTGIGWMGVVPYAYFCLHLYRRHA